jgi:hypothetical protein
MKLVIRAATGVERMIAAALRQRSDIRLGAMSPISSWTRDPASTPNCGNGSQDPEARLVDFDDEDPSRRLLEEDAWK